MRPIVPAGKIERTRRTRTIRPGLEPLEGRVVLSTFVVTTTSDTAAGSLRQAITESNDSTGPNTIDFDIPGSGPEVIAPLSPLPTISTPVVIDGFSQPGASRNTDRVVNNAVLRIAIDGSEVSGGASGLTITSSDTTVQGLSIYRFPGSGIALDDASGDVIRGDFLGSDTTGITKLGNAEFGLSLVDMTDCVIGGLDPGDSDIVGDNNGGGITLVNGDTTGNLIEGDYVGVASDGKSALGNNAFGILLANGASSNTVGGSVAAARNVVDDSGVGVSVSNLNTDNNLVIGNYVGTDSTGTAILQNDEGVIVTDGAQNNTVGGTSPGDRNIISGNFVGVLLKEVSTVSDTYTGPLTVGNRIEGNYIGTDVTGTKPLPNLQFGLLMTNVRDTVIGGVEPGAGNVISATVGVGLQLIGQFASNNQVYGNLIGTDATGLATSASLASQSAGVPGPFGNLGGGIDVNTGSGNTIGGTAPGQANVISGNGVAGIQFFNAPDNVAAGNRIGLDVTGTTPIGNSPDGVLVNNSPSNTIAGNAISANAGNGIQVVGPASSGNSISGNAIGTDATGSIDSDPTGTLPLGNALEGVYLNDAPDNTVGGTTGADRNVISGNLQNGVLIYNATASGNVVEGNAIGTDVTGTIALGNGAAGVAIQDSGQDVVADDLISANAIGVRITGSDASSNTISGDTIGTNLAGSAAIANQFGISIEGSSGNLIQSDQVAGNAVVGVQVTGFGASGNAIFGSDIGANASGTAPLSNGIGVFFNGVSGNFIGGSDPGQGNLISGNATSGVEIYGRFAGGNEVQGNLIGTDGLGLRAIAANAQTVGVLISDAPGLDLAGDQAAGNVIGGLASGSRNVISGNGVGVEISGKDSRANFVIDDLVGPSAFGKSGAGNGIGVYLNEAPSNTIGGSVGNVISGNSGVGVYLLGSGTTGNVIAGNLVGLGPDGSTPLPNQDGFYLENAPDNTIGGSTSTAGNVITSNSVAGVYILGDESTDNLVKFNRIGLAASGSKHPGNGQYGVLLYNAPTNTIVRSGHGSNLIAGAGIADFREFTGDPVVGNPASGTSTASTSSIKKSKRSR